MRLTVRLQPYFILLSLLFSVVACKESKSRGSVADFTTKPGATFTCESAEDNVCRYVLYSTACVEVAPVNGKDSISCTQTLLEQFNLKVGESKVVVGLPANTKLCSQTPGKKFRFLDCVR